jgi:hypothetical protein
MRSFLSSVYLSYSPCSQQTVAECDAGLLHEREPFHPTLDHTRVDTAGTERIDQDFRKEEGDTAEGRGGHSALLKAERESKRYVSLFLLCLQVYLF